MPNASCASTPAQFRIVYDPDGVLPENFGVRGMPTSFLIDRNGQVQSRHEGFLLRDREALAQQVRALVLAHDFLKRRSISSA